MGDLTVGQTAAQMVGHSVEGRVDWRVAPSAVWSALRTGDHWAGTTVSRTAAMRDVMRAGTWVDRTVAPWE
jgi:hypothetical protein